MTRLALSHPHISFQFINNGQSKLHTSGNGKLKDVIYHIYGRDIAANLLKAEYDAKGLKVTGFLGKPIIPEETVILKIIMSMEDMPRIISFPEPLKTHIKILPCSTSIRS